VRALVTGSAGFVGTHLVNALKDRGFAVMGADKKTGTNLAWGNAEEILMELPRPDVIFHLAGSCSTLGSIEDPCGTFRDTVITAANVLDYARYIHVPVILTSSVKARDGMTPYGAAKRMVETWATEMAATYHFPLVINRPGTIYGPGQEGSLESGWIAWFLKAKREGIKVTVNGDGLQRRDLLHVSDYVELMIMQAQGTTHYIGHPWDVGGGSANAVTVMDIVKYLGLEYEHGPERYGDARSYVGFNGVPGWEPRVLWRTSETFL